MLGTRYFRVAGTVAVSRNEVLDWLDVKDDSYEPTEKDWYDCAFAYLEKSGDCLTEVQVYEQD